MESQLSLINSSEWEDILRPTATYLQTSDEAFREVLEKVLEEDPAETSEEDLEITCQLDSGRVGRIESGHFPDGLFLPITKVMNIRNRINPRAKKKKKKKKKKKP